MIDRIFSFRSISCRRKCWRQQLARPLEQVRNIIWFCLRRRFRSFTEISSPEFSTPARVLITLYQCDNLISLAYGKISSVLMFVCAHKGWLFRYSSPFFCFLTDSFLFKQSYTFSNHCYSTLIEDVRVTFFPSNVSMKIHSLMSHISSV